MSKFAIAFAALACFATAAVAGQAHAQLAAANRNSSFGGTYWFDSERGWHWYEDPPSEPNEKASPAPKRAAPTGSSPGAPAKAPELAAFEVLQKRMEESQRIAYIRPTEENVRRYLDLQAIVVEKASHFADVWQRVIWASPELDPTVTGRPVNAKALEVFDREQALARANTVANLAHTHALFFFFRSDCPYCHQFAPLLKAFEARFGLKVVPISVDGGGLPAFPNPRLDNGIARTLDVHQVPALFLAEPGRAKITPIGYGVLSESELLERIHVLVQPDADKAVPSAARVVPPIAVR